MTDGTVHHMKLCAGPCSLLAFWLALLEILVINHVTQWKAIPSPVIVRVTRRPTRLEQQVEVLYAYQLH